MVSEINFMREFRKLFSHENIISISGESGTGKTTLALDMVGNLITSNKQAFSSCIWIQASEYFPKKRLTQMFKNHPNNLRGVNENIFIIPKRNPVSTYEAQSKTIQTIFNSTSMLPPNLKFIVIDNISHHLRFKIAQSNDFSYKASVLDDFYESQLLPLILFCQRNDITLILIHEVSFNPNSMKNRPFYHKLYDRMKTVEIILNNIYNDSQKEMKLSVNNHKYSFIYELGDCGIKFNKKKWKINKNK
jgi:RecA/RadA recombinase